jgi:hypothetical protein
MTIEQQLKALKKSRIPAPEAVNSTRRLLTQRAHYLSSIQAQASVYRTMQIGMWQTWRFSFAHVRQVAAVLIITILSGTGTMVARASMAAVSGDTLYPVKRNLIEKVELVLAPSAQDEATVYLRHVATRLDEIRMINERGLPEEEREQRVGHTVLALNRDLTSARQSLRMAATEENSDSSKVVALAKDLTKGAANVRIAMKESQLTGGGLSLKAATAQVAESASQAHSEGVNVLVGQRDNSAAVPDGELRSLVADETSETELHLAAVTDGLKLAISPDVNTRIRQALADSERLRQPLAFQRDELDRTSRDVGLAQIYLHEAERLSGVGDFNGAMEWNAKAGEAIGQLEYLLNQASELVNQELIPSWQPVATSTSAVTSTTATTTAAKAADEAEKK